MQLSRLIDRWHKLNEWHELSIDPVRGLLEKPGLYVLHAKAVGIKGILGGHHSWLASKLSDGRTLVAEVTDLETLDVQGGQLVASGKHLSSSQHRAPLACWRDAEQRWFGAVPEVSCFLPISDDQLLYEMLVEIVLKYPLRNKPFRILHRNCNTMVSWAVHHLAKEHDLILRHKRFLIGAKPIMMWRLFH